LKHPAQFANRVIDPDQFASRFRPMAVYGDETSYPGMIYPWLDAPRLLDGLANPDALRHAALSQKLGWLESEFGLRLERCANCHSGVTASRPASSAMRSGSTPGSR
jgi:hypothetical protein